MFRVSALILSIVLRVLEVRCQIPFDHRSLQDARIVGGQILSSDQIPFQAVIRQRLDSKTSIQCGAILIHAQWILSAAHCLKEPNIELAPVDAFFGVSRLSQIPNLRHPLHSSSERGFSRKRVELQAQNRVLFVHHDRWNWNLQHFEHFHHQNRATKVIIRRVIQVHRPLNETFENFADVILLRLDKPVPSQKNIRPIDLPEADENFANQLAFVSGFGATSFSENEPLFPSNNLQFSRVPILSKSHCTSMFRDAFEDSENAIKFIRPKSVMCAGFLEGGRDSCVGDSGGPLAVCLATESEHNKNFAQLCPSNRWKLAGIISLGFKCAEPGIPGLYTNVAKFTEWIHSTIFI